MFCLLGWMVDIFGQIDSCFASICCFSSNDFLADADSMTIQVFYLFWSVMTVFMALLLVMLLLLQVTSTYPFWFFSDCWVYWYYDCYYSTKD